MFSGMLLILFLHKPKLLRVTTFYLGINWVSNLLSLFSSGFVVVTC
jgi:hypothetical protein